MTLKDFLEFQVMSLLFIGLSIAMMIAAHAFSWLWLGVIAIGIVSLPLWARPLATLLAPSLAWIDRFLPQSRLFRWFGTMVLLVTEDKDFGELIYNRGQPSSGVLLLRILNKPFELRARMVLSVINDHSEDLLDQFTVLANDSLRIRSIPAEI